MSPAGRRPGKSTAADDILEAARAAFARHGFQGTTIRAVATQAGVNQALVRHYYGSKQQLFAAALAFPAQPVAALLTSLHTAPPAELGSRLAAVFVHAWLDPATSPQLQAFFRSAATTAEGSAAARQLIEHVLLPTLTGALGVSAIRVATAAALLLGYAFQAHLVGAPPMAELDEASAIGVLAPLLQEILTG